METPPVPYAGFELHEVGKLQKKYAIICKKRLFDTTICNKVRPTHKNCCGGEICKQYDPNWQSNGEGKGPITLEYESKILQLSLPSKRNMFFEKKRKLGRIEFVKLDWQNHSGDMR